jgi:hypothetical protein
MRGSGPPPRERCAGCQGSQYPDFGLPVEGDFHRGFLHRGPLRVGFFRVLAEFADWRIAVVFALTYSAAQFTTLLFTVRTLKCPRNPIPSLAVLLSMIAGNPCGNGA